MVFQQNQHTRTMSTTTHIDRAITRGTANDRRPDALTEDGKKYLTQVLDPYHDFNVGGVGIPTANSSASYLRNVRLRRAITYPAAASPTGAWDLHVFTTPVYCQQAAGTIETKKSGSGTVANPYVVVNDDGFAANIQQLSHVCFVWCPTGSPLGITHAAAVWEALPIGSPDWGAYRLVSSGFEIHNTTPELYRSGSVTTWRANSTTESSLLLMTPLASGVKFAYNRTYNGIPATLALANQMATSRTWDAAEGCYVVSQPDFLDIGFRTYDEGTVTIRTGAQTAGIRTSIVVGGFATNGATESSIVYRSGITPAGAVFAGLDPHSTFSLDCRVLVEVSPDLDVEDLSLASQPVTTDPCAMELAALAFSTLPSGVPVNRNAAGDWFRMVLSSIAKVAPLVAGIVPHPVAKIALGAAGAAAQAAHAAIPARAPAPAPAPAHPVAEPDAAQRMLPAARQPVGRRIRTRGKAPTRKFRTLRR